MNIRIFFLLISLILSSETFALQAPPVNYTYTVSTNVSSGSSVALVGGAIVSLGLGYLLYENSNNPQNLAINLFLLGGYGISALPSEKERHLGSYSLGLMIAYNGLVAKPNQKKEVFLVNASLYALGRFFGGITWKDERSAVSIYPLIKNDLAGVAVTTIF